MRIIRQAAFAATPWKNGGGITHEAIRVPASGDPFSWRVSVAHIEKSGPFSDFAAYNRIMVLLRGNGAALKFANGDVRGLRNVGDVVRFDGALAAHCELENGPCVDLNLIAAKSMRGVHAEVRRLDAAISLTVARGRRTLIFPIDAPLVVQVESGAGTAGGGGTDTAALEPWDLAVISGAAERAAKLTTRGTSAALVFVATLPDA